MNIRPTHLALAASFLLLGACKSTCCETCEEPASEPPPAEAGPDAEAGAAFYEVNRCAECHVEGSVDPFAPPGLSDADAETLLAFMDGSAPHSGGSIEGVTAVDAVDLAAFLSGAE